MDLSLPEALKGPPQEVLPSHYLVVESRATQHRDPRLAGKFTSLAEAHNFLLENSTGRRSLHIAARYPDKSVKSLYSTGELSGGYGTYSSDREPLGHFTDHTPELQTYSGAQSAAHADAAAVSEHHYADLLNHQVAELVLRGGLSPFREDPKKAIGTEPHKFLQQALATGDHTPLLAMADYLEEQGGNTSLVKMVRKAIEKKQDKVDRLRSYRTLRTGGR